jgi:hypothetical protein
MSVLSAKDWLPYVPPPPVAASPEYCTVIEHFDPPRTASTIPTAPSDNMIRKYLAAETRLQPGQRIRLWRNHHRGARLQILTGRVTDEMIPVDDAGV